MIKIIFSVFLLALGVNSYAWNAMGHQLIAQIAYDNLTPTAKSLCNKYNRSLNKTYPAGNFVHSSIWLDKLKASDVHWFDHLHYIDIPFSNDDSKLPSLREINALWGINQAVSVLSSKKPSYSEKGLSLRILIHTVGDIHQPLHTATLTTQTFAHGDAGGNLFPLAKNPIARNLHSYWDKGGGILVGDSTSTQIRNKARQLESRWTCQMANKQKKPEQWILSAHDLAMHQVYTINPGATPSKRYQLNAQDSSQKQILLAGCRLANLINNSVKL